MYVIFDQGPLTGGTVFAEPVQVLRAETPGDVAPVFAAIESARRAGKWLAGYTAYELGYVLQPKLSTLMPAPGDTPLMEFGVFDAPSAASARAIRAAPENLLDPLCPELTAAQHRALFDRVQAYISAGDIYQANLTFPLITASRSDARSLYAALSARQTVPHGALASLGGPTILSRSPELFFRVDGDGRIETRPMKGTMPRGDTPERDAANRARLITSEKDRAENLMIVDLLRNDIGRVARIGSVSVPDLFAIETYTTVHQMVSSVTAQLRDGVTVQDLFAALFPCGSITGAPKIRAMEIIAELEPNPRGAYCGAVGWISPDGPMAFNVAIRTLTMLDGGGIRLNVGGGIVHDSTADGEYAEALLKARFAELVADQVTADMSAATRISRNGRTMVMQA